MDKRILLVEDEVGVQITLEDRFTMEGYDVTIEGDGISGEKTALEGNFDLIILDVMLPGRDGFGICQNLRAKGICTPILMLTARASDLDTVTGLRQGADDYLSKPFDMGVLLARIEALLRRSHGKYGEDEPTKSSGQIVFGAFLLDRERGVLLKDNKEIELNAQEYRLLEYLTIHPDRVISRDTLLDEVWGYGASTTSRTVDVHIAKLRSKVDDSDVPRHILTIRGRGYKFLPIPVIPPRN